MRRIAAACTLLIAIACSSPNLDIQGHRGCRGLFPENTIPGFKKALDLGVTTLEMDVVISTEGLVVVSHEPWLNPEICLDPTGHEIPEGRGMEYNLFAMTYDSITQCDCGMKPHPRFPDQVHYPAHKPLLSTVIDSIEVHAKETGRDLPQYSIEIKYLPITAGIWNPDPVGMSALVMKVLREKRILDRTVIQSFDPNVLQSIHKMYPTLKTSLLVEAADPMVAMDSLGFDPTILSPDQTLVTEELIDKVHDRGVKIIPWTVNDPGTADRLIEWGVDGLITDYPDRVPSDTH